MIWSTHHLYHLIDDDNRYRFCNDPKFIKGSSLNWDVINEMVQVDDGADENEDVNLIHDFAGDYDDHDS